MYTDNYFNRFELAPEVAEALKKCKCIAYAETKEELQEMAYGPTHTSRYDVVYPIEGLGTVKEAEVVRCKNGCVVNFMEDYMRRRDPNSMAIGDELPTDKPRFKDRFGYEFSKLRQETLDWLSNQQIVMLPFYAGPNGHGYPSLMICPMNAAFFALSLANMQGFVSIADVPEHYKPRAIIYVAPPFRHTHFDGKQVVVHNRSAELHEVWAYNLYPGPSAKKGVFSLLLDIGEHEGWVCCHTSAAMVETPYENEIVFMHEGASGGGKSEMLEDFHREDDDRLLIGTHTVTGEKYYMTLGESCKIHPIADDMACALKSIQDPTSGKLRILDAENGWFLRMDGMNAYGNNPLYERICIHPSEPLVFFNMDGIPGSTCLIWEHVIEFERQALLKPARHPAAQDARQHRARHRAGGGRCAQLRRADAAEHREEPELRRDGYAAGRAAEHRLAVASGLAARLQEPVHRGHERRQRSEGRGRWLLLAVRHGAQGHAGESAARADHE